MAMAVQWSEVGTLIDGLYRSVDRLQAVFPGRKFTLDGHLVGSIGEVLAAYMFDPKLNPASTLGHDAIAKDGRPVEIKLTQTNTVAIRHQPAHLIVLRKRRNHPLSVVFNGSGEIAWQHAGKVASNGQRPISIAKLMKLDAEMPPHARLPLVRPAPI
jgi:hypothetical protein